MSEQELLNLYIEQDIDFYNSLTIPEQVLYKIQIRDTISFKKICLRYYLNDLKDNIKNYFEEVVKRIKSRIIK